MPENKNNPGQGRKKDEPKIGFGTNLPTAMYERLNKEVAKQGRQKNEIVRRAFEMYFAALDRDETKV